MSIVSSAIVEDRAQQDGRRTVRERHVDQLGSEYFSDYIAEQGQSLTTLLTNHASQIDADLIAAEVERNLLRAYDQLSPTFNYSTIAQFRARLRAEFQTATAWDAVRLGKFIQAQGLTDNQLKALFGINDAQLVTLKAKLVGLASKYDDVIQQVGS